MEIAIHVWSYDAGDAIYWELWLCGDLCSRCVSLLQMILLPLVPLWHLWYISDCLPSRLLN